jgi:hypothetical protein
MEQYGASIPNLWKPYESIQILPVAYSLGWGWLDYRSRATGVGTFTFPLAYEGGRENQKFWRDGTGEV